MPAKLKFVVWNTSWMNDLFTSPANPNAPAHFRADADHPQHSPKTTVRKRRDDLAGVLRELSPDVVVVVEGPNRMQELQLFFDQDMGGGWAVHVQPTKGQSQCVGVALRKDKFGNPPIATFETSGMKAFSPFAVDVDEDEVPEQYHFERMPLYVELNPKGGGKFRILGLHLKSKAIFEAYEWSKWWAMSEGNRRKLLAQATQLRLGFLDNYLKENETKNIPLIVCGDINDGPGLDACEKKFYGSAVERLMGSVWHPSLCLGNAVFDAQPANVQVTLDFQKISTTSFKDPIFDVWQHEWIDHILYTKQNGPWVTKATIEKELGGAMIWTKYPEASDHQPVSAEISV